VSNVELSNFGWNVELARMLVKGVKVVEVECRMVCRMVGRMSRLS